MSETHSGLWYRLTASNRSEAGGLIAEAAADSDSPWFSGHFPGEPILPGIAQLSMVLETLRAAAGRKVRITGLRRVRFKQAIRPGERLRIYVQPNGKSTASHSFQIKIGDDIACSGTLIAEETDS